MINKTNVKKALKKAKPAYKWGSTTPDWEHNTEKIALLDELANAIDEDDKAHPGKRV